MSPLPSLLCDSGHWLPHLENRNEGTVRMHTDAPVGPVHRKHTCTRCHACDWLCGFSRALTTTAVAFSLSASTTGTQAHRQFWAVRFAIPTEGNGRVLALGPVQVGLMRGNHQQSPVFRGVAERANRNSDLQLHKHWWEHYNKSQYLDLLQRVKEIYKVNRFMLRSRSSMCFIQILPLAHININIILSINNCTMSYFH